MTASGREGSPGVPGTAGPSGGRIRAFRIIAWVMAVSGAVFGLFTVVLAIVGEGQEIHAVHNVVVAALLLVISVPPAIAAARDPESAAAPLRHLVAVGVAGLATMAVGLKIDVFTLPFIVLVGVLLALRVARRPATDLGGPSLALVVLVIAATVPLVAYALGQAELSRTDTTSEHAELNHWVETSFYAVAILLLGALAAVRPAAHRLAAWSAGIALAVLGGSSLIAPGRPSAVDETWAWAAVAGSVVFLAVTEWETRRRLSPQAAPAAS
jgi:hypothetical protein